MNEPQLDPFTMAVAIAAALVGPKLAPYVGAYTLILFGWFGGVLVGVYRRDAAMKMGTVGFVIVSFILTFGVTVTASQVLAPYLETSVTYMFFPVAFLIPAVGDTWFKVAAWSWSTLSARWARLWGNP